MEYDGFPPLTIFKKVLQIEPQAALLFISIWKQKKHQRRLSYPKSDVKNQFLISPTLFRNNLLALGRLDVLTFEETADYFLIDFVDQNYA